MQHLQKTAGRPATLSVKVGQWFEIKASGWAVAVAPLVLVLIAASGLLALVLRS